jgi:3-oxoacyl-[acyl-carrier-protein] synthase III
LLRGLETSDEWIVERIGTGVTLLIPRFAVSDLAVAARQALQAANLDARH